MKFLVDAQLPKRFVGWLEVQGHDAIHTCQYHPTAQITASTPHQTSTP